MPAIELPFRSPIDQAFIWRSRDFLQKSGRLGLILDAKNFFSQEGQSLASKRWLFSNLRARVMLNLSVLHDKKLFPSAKQPAMVFVAENCKPKKGDTVVYASAERSETFRKHGIVELFLERLNFLPIARIPDEPHLFRIASYGTARDRAIIKDLFSCGQSLERVLSDWGTGLHQGFIRGTRLKKIPDGLPAKMLEAHTLSRFHQPLQGLPRFHYAKLEHAREPSIYKGPLCIVQQSFQNDRFASAICDRSVVYSLTYFGINFASKYRPQYEALCVFLNSSVAAYTFLMTATRFGIDKQIAMPNDVLRFPFRSNAANKEYAALAALCNAASTFTDIDDAVFDFFRLQTWQREYITDTIRHDLDFVRHGSKGSNVQAANDDDLRLYAETMVKFIRSNLSREELTVNADVVTGLSDLQCVVIRFDEDRNREVRFTSKPEDSFSSRLAELLHAPLASGIQLRRSLIHFDEDRCLIAKLAQKRFWSRARAYDDADSIFDEFCRGGE